MNQSRHREVTLEAFMVKYDISLPANLPGITPAGTTSPPRDDSQTLTNADDEGNGLHISATQSAQPCQATAGRRAITHRQKRPLATAAGRTQAERRRTADSFY